MKKTIILISILAIWSWMPILAGNLTDLQEVLKEEGMAADTPADQKQATVRYFKKIAKEHRELAKEILQKAKHKSGKEVYAAEAKKKAEEKAKQLEEEAKMYDGVADQIKASMKGGKK